MKLKLSAVALVSAVMVSAPSWATAKDLLVGMSGTPNSLDPHQDSNALNSAISRHMWDSLVNLTGTAGNKPELAKAWRNLDDTRWEFELRDDVTFHDGSTFDADDVVASLIRARDKPSKAFASYTRNIAKVEKTGPYTVVVETKRPDPLILNSLARIRIISADCAEAPVQDFDSGKCAAGTGAFKYSSYSPGDRLVMVKNEQYFAGPSEWDEVTLRFMPDDGARLASLLAQEADIIEALSSDGKARVEKDERLKVISGQSSRLVYLGMDVKNDVSPFLDAGGKNPLKDIRVRKAMLMAINRPAIIERVLQGNGTLAHQFVGEGYQGYSPNIEAIPYDPQAAKALLAEAGYPNGFTLTMHGPQGRYVKDSEVLQAIGQMLARVGIRTQIEVMPWSLYSDKYSRPGTFSAFFGSWGVNTGEVTNPAVSLVASPNPEKGTGRYNGGGVSDAELDALLDKATTTLTEDARRPILTQISERTFNNLWILPLYYENTVLGAKADIKFTPRGDKYTLAYEVTSAK